MTDTDAIELDRLLRAFLAVANRSGIEDIEGRIRRAFASGNAVDPALQRHVERQLLNWVNTNPLGRHAVAIPAATALYAHLFRGGASPRVAPPAAQPAASVVPGAAKASHASTRSLELVAALTERMGAALRPSERPRFILAAGAFTPAPGVEVICPGQVPIFREYRDRLVVLEGDRNHPELVEKAAKDTYGDQHGRLPRIGSANSEDALTWSFLRTLAARGSPDWVTRMVEAGLARAGNMAVKAPDGGATLALWQRHGPPASYPGREGATEFDAIVTLPGDLVTVEAKVGSGFSTRTTYDADRHQLIRNIDVGSHLAAKLGRTYWPLVLVPSDRTDEIEFVRVLVRDPDALARALPHRAPAELRDIAGRLGVATWEDLLEIAGTPPGGALDHRPLTDLHRRARGSSARIGLVNELLDANLREMFDAERGAAPRRGDRGLSYLQDHDGIPSTGEATSRGEEHLAIALFNRFGLGSTGLSVGATERIRLADYQVPLKARQSDAVGKVDLLGVDEIGRICVIELKAAESAEPPIRAVLEAWSYAAMLAANLDTLVREFAARRVTVPTAAPRVVVWAPETYWRAHAHGLSDLAPLLNRIVTASGIAISLQSLGQVSVQYGLLRTRPTLIGTPLCREIARSIAASTGSGLRP